MKKKTFLEQKFVSTNYTFTILARKPGIIFWEFWLWMYNVKFEPQKNVPVLLVWNVHFSNLIVLIEKIVLEHYVSFQVCFLQQN